MMKIFLKIKIWSSCQDGDFHLYQKEDKRTPNLVSPVKNLFYFRTLQVFKNYCEEKKQIFSGYQKLKQILM